MRRLNCLRDLESLVSRAVLFRWGGSSETVARYRALWAEALCRTRMHLQGKYYATCTLASA